MKLESSDSAEKKAAYKLVPRNTLVDYRDPAGQHKIVSADEETGEALISVEVRAKDGTITHENKTVSFGAGGLKIMPALRR